jgi:hypothetical protein
MNFRETFENRKKEFHQKVKQEILDELNEVSGKNTRWGWAYEDGYFSCQVKDQDTLVILKSDFEPYIFNSLAVLPAVGHPLEYQVQSAKEAGDSVNDLVNQEIED